MTSIKQREELHAAIWKIANDVRGAVDGWDFKQYVLGTLFYRFISEHFTDYVEAGNKSVNYAGRRDDEITPKILHLSQSTVCERGPHGRQQLGAQHAAGRHL